MIPLLRYGLAAWLGALLLAGANLAVVGQAVTIVIQIVAHLDRGDLSALTAVVEQALIDLAVAVVVPQIAGLLPVAVVDRPAAPLPVP